MKRVALSRPGGGGAAGSVFRGRLAWRRGAIGYAVLLGLASGGMLSCVNNVRMCASELGCGKTASCVAGRCLKNGATASVNTARRWLFAPVDTACIARGSRVPNGSAATATLGRDDGEFALLRFAIALPPGTEVVEAYLLLPILTQLDTDPDPISIHAERVVTPWDGRGATWAHPPRTIEENSPRVSAYGSRQRTVRLDVRAIVERWRRRPEDEFGIAIVAAGHSLTGVTFALGPASWAGAVAAPAADEFSSPSSQGGVLREADFSPPAAPGLEGPMLDLYVK